MKLKMSGGVAPERSAIVPLAIAIAAVIAIGVAYYFYVRDQRAYFSSRNLRLLATVADQLDESLRTNEGFVRNYANSRGTPKQYLSGSRSSSEEQSPNNPATYLPGFVSASRDCAVPAAGEAESPPTFSRTLVWRGGEAFVRFTYRELAAAPLPPPAPNGTMLFAAAAKAGAPAATDPCRLFNQVIMRTATAEIPLSSLLDPLLNQSLLGAFDDVMLARGDGTVISVTHEHARTALSRSGEEERLPEHIVMNFSQLVEQTGWRETKELKMSALREATRISEVETSNGKYLLFTQPFSHATVDDDALAKKPDGVRWIVAGIISNHRFMYEVLSVSASIVLIVVAVLLMMICSWPYLRVSLIGDHQRLTIADVLLLGFAALIQASIITMFMLDSMAYSSLSEVSDQQLTTLATRLEDGLDHDLDSAAATLRTVDAWGADPKANDRWTSDILTDRATDLTLMALALPNPYVSIVAWIDDKGMQQYKLTMRSAVPLVPVVHRRYFNDARMNRLVNAGNAANSFAIESIRSAASGETEAVIARPSKVTHLPVVAATVDLVDVTHAVMPPGFGFAVIEDSGKVVFHSEESRNNEENFFTETDGNRTLRSAVYARQARSVDVRYWGTDHRLYVKPLRYLPWTLIVFRDKSLLRTVNTESVAVTLAMLLGNASIYLLVIFLVLLRNPRYRAPQAWPVAQNTPLYARLIVLYTLTIFYGVGVVYAFDARTVLLATMLVPAQAITGTILVLERRRSTFRWMALLVAWIAVAALALYVIWRGGGMPGGAVQNYPAALKIGASALIALTAWATFRQKSYRFDTSHFGRAYLSAGVLLLVVGAVVPTFGFFKVASRLEMEGLVKYSQLYIADRAERAIVGIEQANVTSEAKKSYCEAWEGDPFRMRWALFPYPERAGCWDDPKPVGTGQDVPDRAWLPDIYRDVLPAYSEESVSLRQLHGASTGAALWKWYWRKDFLMLTKVIHLPSSDGQKQAAAANIYGDNPPPHFIHVKARVPLSFAAAMRSNGGWTSLRILWLVLLLLAIAAVIAILFVIVRFFAVKLFLIDLREPLWLSPPPPLKPTLGDHVFLIRSSKTVDELTCSLAVTETGKSEDAGQFVDVTFSELDQDTNVTAWEETLLAIDRAREGQNVRIVDFEYGATDARISIRKLTFLERLIALPNRTVIIASTISPAAFLALLSNADLKKRWTAVLAAFVTATEAQLEAPQTDEPLPMSRDNLAWLKGETEQGAFLRTIREELAPQATTVEREQLIDEIRERSNTYYTGLWASCSEDEKILLQQLARDGLLNGKDRKAVRRLLARGLVRRRPNLRLFNETFRLYVLAAAKRDDVPLEGQEGPSAWDVIRLPLFVVIVSAIIMIFATQKDLLNLTTGLVAALTTGLPAIVRLFGLFTERRSSAAENRS
jgi:hypothetical protein